MKKNIATKQDEIDVLQSLKGDTYFSQYFKADIDQMCQNISNDFPIEMNCQFYKASEVLKKQLFDTMRSMQDLVERNVFQIIDLYQGNVPSELYDVLYKQVSVKVIINHKRLMKYTLNEIELEYLVNLMNEQ